MSTSSQMDPSFGERTAMVLRMFSSSASERVVIGALGVDLVGWMKESFRSGGRESRKSFFSLRRERSFVINSAEGLDDVDLVREERDCSSEWMRVHVSICSLERDAEDINRVRCDMQQRCGLAAPVRVLKREKRMVLNLKLNFVESV